MRKRNLKKLIAVIAVGTMCVATIPVAAAEQGSTDAEEPSGGIMTLAAGDQTVNVKDYGADGSDSESDRLAIQAAFDVAEETDGTLTVEFPAGTYYIDSTLWVRSDTTLQLSDDVTIISTDTRDTAMLSAGYQDEAISGYGKASNIVVDGGVWDRNARGYQGSGFFIYHAQNITLQNLTVQNVNYEGHQIDFSGVKNGTVKNCILQDYAGANLSYNNAEAVHLDATTEETAYSATPYDNTPCQDITVDGCQFINCHGGVGNHHADVSESGITITNNTFDNLTGVCVNVPYMTNVKISGNTGSNIQTFCRVTDSASDIEISNNTLNCKTMNSSVANKHTIYINNAKATVTGNTINNAQETAVFVMGTGSATITGNTITNAVNDGINAVGNSTVTISNNTISGSGYRGISLEENTKYTVSGNTYSNNATDYYAGANTSGTRTNDPASSGSGTSGNGGSGSGLSGLNKVNGTWGYYKNGSVDTSYTGFASNSSGKWYVKNGYVKFDQNTVAKDTDGAIGSKGTWYYVVGSKVQENFTGLANYKNDSGWWYIVKGKVDFSHNGVDKNNNGWYYVTGGKVNFGFTGLANYKNSNGWWYISGGRVDFNHNGVDKNNNGWFYVEGGKFNFNYTGFSNYKNASGWWYIKAGKVDFSYNGYARNKNGRWRVVNGKVRF